MGERITLWGVGAAMTGVTLVAALAVPVSAEADTVAAIFPPWWNPAAAYAAAGEAGDVLAPGVWRNVLLVRVGDAGVVERLTASGAMIVLDANVLGCGGSRLGV